MSTEPYIPHFQKSFGINKTCRVVLSRVGFTHISPLARACAPVCARSRKGSTLHNPTHPTFRTTARRLIEGKLTWQNH